MKNLYLLFFLLIPAIVPAQHCPWDCSSLLMVKTDLSPAEFKKLNPVLVDGSKKILIDSIYGTGKETYDSCRLLFYDDFLAYRTERIGIHPWYRYDTVYHFAKDHYVARFNHCRFGRKQLFIRFKDPSSVSGDYHFIEIPVDRRIHLHDHNNLLYDRKTEELLRSVQPHIMEVSRLEWKLPDK